MRLEAFLFNVEIQESCCRFICVVFQHNTYYTMVKLSIEE